MTFFTAILFNGLIIYSFGYFVKRMLHFYANCYLFRFCRLGNRNIGSVRFFMGEIEQDMSWEQKNINCKQREFITNY